LFYTHLRLHCSREGWIDNTRRENVFGLLMSRSVLIELGDAVDYSAAHREPAMERPLWRNHWHAEEAVLRRNDRAAQMPPGEFSSRVLPFPAFLLSLYFCILLSGN
jgi:hypothetical protein